MKGHAVAFNIVDIVNVAELAIRQPHRIVSIETVFAHPIVEAAEAGVASSKIGCEVPIELRPHHQPLQLFEHSDAGELACPWRNANYAAVGVWKRPEQSDRHAK